MTAQLSFEEKARIRDRISRPENEGHKFTVQVDKYGRVCKSCGAYKFWDGFYPNAGEKTGYKPYCKECEKKAGRVKRAGGSSSLASTTKARKFNIRWVKSTDAWRLTFPKEVFAESAQYISVEVDRSKKLLKLTPHVELPSSSKIKKGLSYRKLAVSTFRGKDTGTRTINFPSELAQSMELMQVEFITHMGSLYIQLPDTSLLPELEAWAISSGRKHNVEILRTIPTRRSIYFSPRRWVASSEYVSMRYLAIGKVQYLDLLPINRAGNVVFASGKVEAIPSKFSGKTKLLPCYLRVVTNARRFFNAHPDIPAGDWDLTNNGKQRPDGSFRYRYLGSGYQFDEHGNELR
jgi:hypothetical protein